MDNILFNEINAELLSHIDIHSFYREHLPGYQPGKESICPFHDDHHPSLKIFENGGYNCKGCPAKGGGPVHFYARLKGYDLRSQYFEAQKELWHKHVEPLVKDKAIRETREQLTPEIRERLLAERGYQSDILDLFKIGWTLTKGGRLTIPIYNRVGFCVGMLAYNVFKNVNGDGKEFPKVQTMMTGYATGRLWPLSVAESHDRLFLCEGEGDTLCALSHGFSGVTVGGAGNRIKGGDLPFLRGKEVIVVFDNDHAGTPNAIRVAEQLVNLKITENVRVVELPEEGQDLTRFLQEEGEEAFERLVEATPMFEPQRPVLLRSGIVSEGEKKDGAAVAPIPFLPLGKLVAEENYGRLIRTEAVVVGKDPQAVVFPRRLKLVCKRPKKKCMGGPCPLAGDFRHEYTVDFDKENPDILKFAECSDAGLTRTAKELLGIPAAGCSVTCDILSSYTAMKILVSPVVKHRDSRTADDTTFLLFAYFFSTSIASMNVPYLFQGYAHRHPRDSAVVAMFTSAEPVALSVNELEITDDLVEKLADFRVPETEDLFDYLMRYYDHCASSLTFIRGRPLTHMAADLVFFSPISFYFQDNFVRRASLDVLIFGDTRCGKNQITESLMRYYEHGELVSGENMSYMNIMGGIQAISKYKGPCWGRLAKRNRDTIVIDETSSIPATEIGRLSTLRSAGVAEIHKQGFDVKTDALTGILWLSNPRDNRMLANHHHCMDIILELMGNTEDVSRLDYAHAVAVDDVSSKEINKRYLKDEHKWTSEQYHMLILWVKSRTPEQIEFTEAATDAIFKHALELSALYHPSGYLVQGENIRTKLAKISAAIAGKVWSTDPRGEKMVVADVHVECAVKFLRALYDSPVMGYASFSKNKREKETVDEKRIDSLIRMVAVQVDMEKSDIVKTLLFYDHISENLIGTYIGLDYTNARNFLNVLGVGRAILPKYNHHVKTKAFKEYLERRLKFGFEPKK